MARQMTAAKPSPSAERPRQMNGAQTLVEALRREGVEVLFGHPGGASLPIYDTFYDAMDIPKAVRMAFYLAKTGRPGPVLVDIPRDVSQELCEPDFDEDPVLPGYRPVVDGNPGQIAEAADALSAAERPIVYAGGGIISSGATPELTALVERTGIPVVLTLMGKGAMDETHPRCLGMFGMHGSAFANWAINRADVILAVGVRFDDRVTGRLKDFAPTPVS